ncbi:NF2 [Cordylochernes scorpioides]|uniref:NF2 n=1 Tax=Cordylochernes scorpioides TaxID=51811 RepID=A0ABY6LNU6_9ARAC|nr:NF2 [Cordylochernes scorpioides]
MTFTNPKRSKKMLTVNVKTMDAELEFDIAKYVEQKKAKGQELFDLVCRTIGLRETWYFGLQYVDRKGNIAWLRGDKQVSLSLFGHFATDKTGC